MCAFFSFMKSECIHTQIPMEKEEQLTPYTLLSGGATGADQVFGNHAAQAGFTVLHLTVQKSTLGDGGPQHQQHYIPMSEEQLAAADPALKQAAKHVRKHMPRPGYVRKLLQRNWHQVRDVDRVYAIGWIIPDNSLLHVEGGTGWTCQMYVQRFEPWGSESHTKCVLYLYDQANKEWLQWLPQCRQWSVLPTGPPRPAGKCAGIGSRNLTPEGAAAIAALFK